MKPVQSIQLTTTPFEEILERGESIDFRLDEERWRSLKKGDIIEFWEDLTGWQTTPEPNARRTTVKIIDIFRAASFQNILDNPDLQGFFAGHDKQDILIGLRQWWTEEIEQTTGVLGLRVKLIN